jgi:1-acyl-sn-glycerol-3-phosphate acyltransferase
MKKNATRLFTAYAAFLFIITFLIFFPVFFICAQNEKWHGTALKTNYLWARIYFPLIFLRVSMDLRFELKKNQQYILCANHFSYLDIPAIARIPIYSKFIGKNSIASVPLFGYMFRKIHITVNRSSMKSRAESLQKALSVIDSCFSLCFFPEGGIKTKSLPLMTPFLDGAFRASVDKQIPIIPVSFLDNHKIIPDEVEFNIIPGKMRIVLHAPIMPASQNEDEILKMKNKVFEVIQSELNATKDFT